MKILRKLYFRLFTRYRRLEYRFVSYDEGDRLIRGGEGRPESERWVIAPEENRSQIYGYVHLERRERITS